MAIIKGLEGVKAVESSIGFINGEEGKLFYRGYTIEDLAAKKTFEEVVFLLWEDRFPSDDELKDFKNKISNYQALPESIREMILAFPKDTNPMAALRTCVSALALFDEKADDNSEQANKEKAVKILAVTPAIIAAIHRKMQGEEIIEPKTGPSIAENFLYMLHNKQHSGEEIKIFDRCLTLHAEHGLNASTFSSRVTVATLSDIYSGLTSAVGTLKGPLHGGANEKVLETFDLLKQKLGLGNSCSDEDLNKIEEYVKEALQRKERIMGIGHRVYRVKDPRAHILEVDAKRLSEDSPGYYQMAKRIEGVMAREKNLYPNVDFFSGIVYKALNIPTSLFVCIFALSRNAGWLAHMMEQYSDNRLIRPRAEYVGELNKEI